MTFEDIFVEKYRAARQAAIAKDQSGTVAALTDLSKTLNAQYESKNGDPFMTKGNLAYWAQNFAKYAEIARKNGLQDARLQSLFGLQKAESAIPPVSGSSTSKPAKGKSVSEPDLAGLIPDEQESPEPPVTKTPISQIPGMDGLLPDPEEPGNDTATVPEPLDSGNASGEVSVEPAEEIPTPQSPLSEFGLDGENPFEETTPSFEPDSLRSFIGQKHIVKALLKEIAIAKAEGRNHLDNILLFGNPGLGKTTLMSLIAKELGVQFELLDCSQFRNSQQSLKALQKFFLRVAKLNAPVVIALDEIHMLTPELQSSLLTLLNNRVYVSPLDVNGQCQRIPIDDFTFIAATTDDQGVLDTIKNRCLRLKFQLVDYTPEELGQIYRNKFAAKGLTATNEAIALCIPRSRGAIRYVNAIVDGLNSALYTDEGKRISNDVTEDVARNYFAEKGIDSMGLEPKDLEILRAIADARDGIISADVLSAQVGMDVKKYLSEYERYLIKIGFITVSGRGRSLTDKAIRHLNQAADETPDGKKEG